MFDVVRGRIYYPGDDALPGGDLDLLEQLPFVPVARISAFERNRSGMGQEQHVQDVGQWHVAMMRALVVTPADVHSDATRRQSVQRAVQGLDMEPGLILERLQGQMGEPGS